MRKALAPEHRSHFSRLGSIEFDDVLSVQDREKLMNITFPSPHSAPLLSVIRHQQLAEIAAELTGKEPLRIAKVFFGMHIDLQEDQCALCIALDTGHLTYSQLPSLTCASPQTLIIVFTSRYLDVERHPIVYRRG